MAWVIDQQHKQLFEEAKAGKNLSQELRLLQQRLRKSGKVGESIVMTLIFFLDMNNFLLNKI